MQEAWRQVGEVLHSWTYVAMGLAFVLGVLALRLRAVGRLPRLIMLLLVFATLTNLVAPGLPWVRRSIDLHPGPLEAFTSAIIYPLYYGVPAMPALVLLAVILVSTLLLSKIFCGWICPVGVLQELVALARSKPRRHLPVVPCHLVRTGLLVAFAAVLVWQRRALFEWLDPYPPLSSIPATGVLAYLPLAATILASMVFYRPFCALVCPLGLLAAHVQRASALVVKPTARCDRCGECLSAAACPGLRVAITGEGHSHECYACGACLRSCPRGAIAYTWRTPRRPCAAQPLSRSAVAGGGR